MTKQFFKNLPVKTITGESAEEIDRLVNEFRKENKIEFMQTHVLKDSPGYRYIYVCFYIPKEDIYRPCPKCGKAILKLQVEHPECGWKQNETPKDSNQKDH